MSVWPAVVLTVLFAEACLFGFIFGITAILNRSDDMGWAIAWGTVAFVHGCAVLGVLIVLPLYWLWNVVVA